MVNGVSKDVILLVGPIVQSKMSILYLFSLVPSVCVGTDVGCCFCWRRWQR